MFRLLFVLCIIPMVFFAQNEVEVNFRFSFKELPLQQGMWYVTESGDSVQFETLKFFVSQTPKKNEVLTAQKVKLVDWSQPESQHVKLDINDKKELEFTLGLDSIFHVSEIMEGDLDPSLGMYWAWQSGYIQLKLEGFSPSSKSRNNKFQFHLGGYLTPFSIARTYNFGYQSLREIEIELDLWKLMGQVQLAEKAEIMIPGIDAVNFLNNKEQFIEVFTMP